MARSIFISYRQATDAAEAGRLYERLSGTFGRNEVFFDDGGIGLGERYEDKIRAEITGCDVLVIVIGPGWLTVTDAAGQQRLLAASDLHRDEIEIALTRGITIIPVLAGTTAIMPRADQLPDSIRALAAIQGANLRHGSYDNDAKPIIHRIDTELQARRKLAEKQRQDAEDAAEQQRRATERAKIEADDAARKIDAERRVVEAQRVEAARLEAKRVEDARLAAEKAKIDAELARRAAEAKKAADAQAETRRLEAEAARKAEATRKSVEAEKLEDAQLATEKAKRYWISDEDAARYTRLVEKGEAETRRLEAEEVRKTVWMLALLLALWLAGFLIGFVGGPSWLPAGQVLGFAGTIIFGGWFINLRWDKSDDLEKAGLWFRGSAIACIAIAATFILLGFKPTVPIIMGTLPGLVALVSTGMLPSRSFGATMLHTLGGAMLLLILLTNIASLLSWRWWGGETNTGFLLSALCVMLFHFWLVTVRIVRYFSSVTHREVTIQAVIAALLSLSFFFHLSSPLGLRANDQIGWSDPFRISINLAVPVAVYWIMAEAWVRRLTQLWRRRRFEARS